MKYILSVLFLFFFFSGFTQIYQEMPQYGYRANRMAFDSTLQIPTVCGVPTLKSVVSVNRKAAVAFDSCNNKFYTYNPKTLTWSEVSGGGATPPLQDVLTIGKDYTDDLGNTIRLSDYENISGADTYYPIRFFDNGESLPSLNIIEDMSMSNQKSELKMGNFGNFEATNFTLNTDSLSIKKGYGGTNNELILNYDGLKINKNEAEYTNLNFLNSNNYGNNYDVHLPFQNGSLNDTLYTFQNFRTDTTNKWVNDVTRKNDSTITIYKNTSATDITISSVSNAKRLTTNVYNASGATIAKGSVVYINGRHSSNLPTILKAQANDENNSYKTFAIVENDIADNSAGVVIQAGNIGNLNLPTSSYTDGDIVYLSPTIAGGITITKPLAPLHICKIGSVTRAHPTLGSIEIKIENGWQLDELSDVQIPAVPNDSTLLQFSRVDSLWHSVSVNNAIGTKYIKPSDTATMLTPYIRLAGTGLTKSSQTLSNNLSTGVAGGQSVVGGTAASENLTLSSTTNATKGKILFGTSAYDEVNNRLGIGTASPATTVNVIGSTGYNALRIGDGTGYINQQYNRGATGSWLTQTTTASTGIMFEYSHATNPGFNFLVPGLVAMGLGMDNAGMFMSNTTSSYPGTTLMKIFNGGNIAIGTSSNAGYKLDVNGTARVQGALNFNPTNTAAGTTGNQTINKASGTVNIAAAGTTVTVTNNLVTTSSIVFAVIRTNDATATIKNVVPASGSFTINLNAATTAETSIGFFVIN